MKKNIYFFEVKSDEKPLVLKDFPEAKIFHEAFSSQYIDEVRDAHILSGMVHCDFSAENLSKLPHLELIVTRSVGYNHIDLAYCQEHSIKVAHVPDYGSHVIAEHVFALLLSSVRRILEGEERTEHLRFDEEGLIGMALKGKTLGVIGTGKIGAHVCRIGSKGFLMNVLAYDVHPNENLARDYQFNYVSSLDELYEQSDIITLHLPLFPSTKHLINRESIARMKDGVVLINTSRGGIIDTEALIDAIKRGKFSHVALDVVEHEENIKEAKELLELPGVIITPHMAYYTRESVENMYRIGNQSIFEYLLGKDIQYLVQGI